MSDLRPSQLEAEWRVKRGAFAADAHISGHPVRRAAWLVAGMLAVGLGTLGAFLPLLPTTPLMLLGAACFARSSGHFYNAVLSNPSFGFYVYQWRETRSIPKRAKVLAISLILVTFGVSISFFVNGLGPKLAMASVGVIVAAWLATRPTGPS